MERLANKYGLYPYHSGGGCVHFAYDTKPLNIGLQWLINGVDGEEHEPIIDAYPENSDQLCMFGLDFHFLEDSHEDAIAKCLSALTCKMLLSLASITPAIDYVEDDRSFYFIDTLERGVLKMKELTNYIYPHIKEMQ